MEGKKRVSVVGSGSWATAIVKILHEAQPSIGWYIREQKIIDHIKKHRNNPFYLSSVQFDLKKLKISNDLNEIVKNSDVLVFVVPASFIKIWMEPLKVNFDNKFVLSAIKGIIPEDDTTIAEYFNRTHNVPFDQSGIISGPTHAEEVALERVSYLTFSCKNTEHAKEIASLFESHYIKTNIGIAGS